MLQTWTGQEIEELLSQILNYFLITYYGLRIVLLYRCVVVNEDDAWDFVLNCGHREYKFMREVLKIMLHNSHLVSLDE